MDDPPRSLAAVAAVVRRPNPLSLRACPGMLVPSGLPSRAPRRLPVRRAVSGSAQRGGGRRPTRPHQFPRRADAGAGREAVGV